MTFKRLTIEDALKLAQNPDFLTLGRLADERSKTLNGKKIAYTLKSDSSAENTAILKISRDQLWTAALEQMASLRDQSGNEKFQTVLVEYDAGVTSHEYLRLVAITRIFLDNIQHVQTSGFSEEFKVGQLALNFGADDLGQVADELAAIAAIVETGHIAYRRDELYREIATEQTRELSQNAANKLRYGT